MRLDELVPTRETCERMKAAGFDQRTHFGWYEPEPPPTWLDAQGEGPQPPYLHAIGQAGQAGILAAAPTFAEIAERLSAEHPDYWQVDRPYEGTMGPRGYRARYSSDGPDVHGRGNSPTEALAALWLALSSEEADASE